MKSEEWARRHIESRLKSARHRYRIAVEEVARFARQAEQGDGSGWHNLAATVALGDHARGEIEAYETALAAFAATGAP